MLASPSAECQRVALTTLREAFVGGAFLLKHLTLSCVAKHDTTWLQTRLVSERVKQCFAVLAQSNFVLSLQTKRTKCWPSTSRCCWRTTCWWPRR